MVTTRGQTAAAGTAAPQSGERTGPAVDAAAQPQHLMQLPLTPRTKEHSDFEVAVAAATPLPDSDTDDQMQEITPAKPHSTMEARIRAEMAEAQAVTMAKVSAMHAAMQAAWQAEFAALNAKVSALEAQLQQQRATPSQPSYAAIAAAGGAASQAPARSSDPAPNSKLSREITSVLEHRDGFKVEMSSLDLKTSTQDAAAAIQAVLKSKLQLDVSIEHVRPLPIKTRNPVAPADVLANSAVRTAHQVANPDGTAPTAPRPLSFFFRLSQANADSLRKCRPQLKGKGLVIHDWLTADELAQQRALWPAFKTARGDSRRTHWNRARLFVDGVEIASPAVAVPAAPTA